MELDISKLSKEQQKAIYTFLQDEEKFYCEKCKSKEVLFKYKKPHICVYCAKCKTYLGWVEKTIANTDKMNKDNPPSNELF